MKTKLAAFLIPAVFALLDPMRALAQQPAGPYPSWDWPGPWHMWGGGGGFWWIFPLIMLFLIIACVAFFLFGHRPGGHHGGPWHAVDRPWGPDRSRGDPANSALQILNERFARGEIQKEEYEERKAAIASSGRR